MGIFALVLETTTFMWRVSISTNFIWQEISSNLHVCLASALDKLGESKLTLAGVLNSSFRAATSASTDT